jgi:hypothetical protein
VEPELSNWPLGMEIFRQHTCTNDGNKQVNTEFDFKKSNSETAKALQSSDTYLILVK